MESPLNKFNVGDIVLIRATVVGVKKDSDYHHDWSHNSEHMYEVEISPDWDSMALRGNMLDNVEIMDDQT